MRITIRKLVTRRDKHGHLQQYYQRYHTVMNNDVIRAIEAGATLPHNAEYASNLHSCKIQMKPIGARDEEHESFTFLQPYQIRMLRPLYEASYSRITTDTSEGSYTIRQIAPFLWYVANDTAVPIQHALELIRASKDDAIIDDYNGILPVLLCYACAHRNRHVPTDILSELVKPDTDYDDFYDKLGELDIDHDDFPGHDALYTLSSGIAAGYSRSYMLGDDCAIPNDTTACLPYWKACAEYDVLTYREFFDKIARAIPLDTEESVEATAHAIAYQMYDLNYDYIPRDYYNEMVTILSAYPSTDAADSLALKVLEYLREWASPLRPHPLPKWMNQRA